MNSFQKTEVERLRGLLPITDPTTPAYSYLMQNLEVVANTSLFEDIDAAFSINERKLVIVEFPKTEPKQTAEVNVGTEVTAEEPTPVDESPFPTVAEEAEPVKAEAAGKTYTGAEVRSALVKARQKGVNITEILHEFGVENFPAFPENRYGELMERLEKNG